MSILAYYPILLSELNILRVSCLLRHGQLVAASVPLKLSQQHKTKWISSMAKSTVQSLSFT